MQPLAPSAGLQLPSRLGTLQVGAEIGRGGTSVVHLAETDDGRLCVIKFLSSHRFPVDETAANRFLREGVEMGRVRHRNVLRILDVLDLPRRPALVLELAEGGSLYELLARGRLTSETALHLFEQMLDGVGALHAARIVHRDLSPRNLLFRGDGTLLVGDFGTARHLDDDTITDEATRLGSLMYISGQQREDPHGARPEDDVFSLAQIAVELLTGLKPHGFFDRWWDYADSSLPLSLMRLVDSMRRWRRSERPSTAGAAAAEFRRLRELDRAQAARRQEQIPVGLPRPRAPERRAQIRKLSQRRSTAAVAQVIGVLLESYEPFALDLQRIRRLLREPSPGLASLVEGARSLRVETLEADARRSPRLRVLNEETGRSARWPFDFYSDEIDLDVDELVAAALWGRVEVDDVEERLEAFDVSALRFGRPCSTCGDALTPRSRQDGRLEWFGGCHNLACGSTPRCLSCAGQVHPILVVDGWGRYRAIGCPCGRKDLRSFDDAPWGEVARPAVRVRPGIHPLSRWSVTPNVFPDRADRSGDPVS